MSPLRYSLNFIKELKMKKKVCVTSIRSDHGGEIENENFRLFYEENGTFHNFFMSYPNFIRGRLFVNMWIFASQVELVNTNCCIICRVL